MIINDFTNSTKMESYIKKHLELLKQFHDAVEERHVTYQIGHFQLQVPLAATVKEFNDAYCETILMNEHYKDQQDKTNWIPFEDWKKLVNIKDKLAAYGL